MEFEGRYEEGNLVIKPIIERKGKDLIIHVPSLEVVNKLQEVK